MKKILMRGVQSPFDNFNAYDTFIFDKLWSNVGNLLFSYSLYKNLVCEDVSIDIYSNIKASDYKSINENYDLFLIPLANAFREDFIPNLKTLTALIKNLTIPCVVAGVGIQSASQSSKELDKAVVEFTKAVSEKSASMGLRGELTYNYMKKLGLESVCEIIGCPSMYTYGDTLPKHKPKKTSPDDIRISINGKNNDHDSVKKYLFNNPYNHIYIPQTTRELKMIYSGMPIKNDKNNYYPLSISKPPYMNDNAVFCTNVQSWFELLGTVDLSIGTRIHGNIAAVLSGTPAFIITTDDRVSELAMYHEIPCMPFEKFDFSKDIYTLYSETDFSSIYKNHAQRYSIFADFLMKNGLEPVAQPNEYFTEKEKQIDFEKPVHCITNVSKKEMSERLNKYYTHIKKKLDKNTKEISELKTESSKSHNVLSAMGIYSKAEVEANIKEIERLKKELEEKNQKIKELNSKIARNKRILNKISDLCQK